MLWQILEYAAWAVSALLIGWMLFDAIKVDSAYTEEMLLSSREGELDD